MKKRLKLKLLAGVPLVKALSSFFLHVNDTYAT